MLQLVLVNGRVYTLCHRHFINGIHVPHDGPLQPGVRIRFENSPLEETQMAAVLGLDEDSIGGLFNVLQRTLVIFGRDQEIVLGMQEKYRYLNLQRSIRICKIYIC